MIARPCTMCRKPAIALLSYLLTGAKRRSHYFVCVDHYARFDIESAVRVEMLNTEVSQPA